MVCALLIATFLCPVRHVWGYRRGVEHYQLVGSDGTWLLAHFPNQSLRVANASQLLDSKTREAQEGLEVKLDPPLPLTTTAGPFFTIPKMQPLETQMAQPLTNYSTESIARVSKKDQQDHRDIVVEIARNYSQGWNYLEERPAFSSLMNNTSTEVSVAGDASAKLDHPDLPSTERLKGLNQSNSEEDGRRFSQSIKNDYITPLRKYSGEANKEAVQAAYSKSSPGIVNVNYMVIHIACAACLVAVLIVTFTWMWDTLSLLSNSAVTAEARARGRGPTRADSEDEHVERIVRSIMYC